MVAATILTFFELSPPPAKVSNTGELNGEEIHIIWRYVISYSSWKHFIFWAVIKARLFPCMAYEKNTINKQVPLHLVPKIMLIFVIDNVFIYLVLTKTCTFSVITVLLYCWGNRLQSSLFPVNLVGRFCLNDKFLNLSWFLNILLNIEYFINRAKRILLPS